MPLNRIDKIEQHPAISLRAWKDGESKIIQFMDEGKDVSTVNGDQVVFTVKELNEIKSLWVKPFGSLHMGLSDFLPVQGKTLIIDKEILKGDVKKGTRYSAVLSNAMERDFAVDVDEAKMIKKGKKVNA